MKAKIILFLAITVIILPLSGCLDNEYNIDTKGLNDLYIYDVTTGTTQMITNSPNVSENFYTFNPDNSKVIISSSEGTYSVNLDGTNKTVISTKQINSPDVSPDGNKIIYVYNDNLFTMNIDGTNDVQLTSSINNLWIPTWSVDGKKIACFSSQGISVIELNGSITNITISNLTHYKLVWSPDSKKILYYKDDGTTYPQIYTYNTETKLEKKLLDTQRFCDVQYWDANSDQIIYVSSEVGYGSDLLSMNPDGTNQNILFHRDYIEDATYSPDKEHILFITNAYDLALTDANGSNGKLINQIQGACRQPKWSSDGKYVLYYRILLYL